ncbi:MAG: hypothetical protein OXQ92_07045 [Boseongicola sp.]|nr:hypothetical protein [Boseongicola sp.]MDD9978154.1 hypothetical protein [Boseongicola sp.]
MRHILLFFSILSAGAANAGCPAPVDIAVAEGRLLKEAQSLPDNSQANRISQELWALWATAPDAKAQEMLDRGMAARATYDFDTAIEAFDALVAYCPDYAEGYNQRAFVNFLRQDYETALTDLEEAIIRSPRHVAAISGKALTLMGLGRQDEAQATLLEALKLNPWIPERNYLVEAPGTDL